MQKKGFSASTRLESMKLTNAHGYKEIQEIRKLEKEKETKMRESMVEKSGDAVGAKEEGDKEMMIKK